jgi:hypothetical protein
MKNVLDLQAITTEIDGLNDAVWGISTLSVCCNSCCGGISNDQCYPQ